VAGHNGYEVDLSAQHWREFGCTLKHIHTLAVPAEIIEGISQETYSPQWRDSLKRSLAQLEQVRLVDPLAIKLATFLQVKRNEVDYLLARSEALAQVLQAQPQTFIICHADIHAGNILIDTEGVFYLVDWDTLILAPKERDLMYVGGGLMAGKRTPQQEEALFYAGYGQTEIDPIALAYYRYARIIEDIAIYCEQILQTTAGEDRVQALHYLRSNFQPNGTIEIARQADQALD
jgi:spectinomycin phosphotransferase